MLQLLLRRFVLFCAFLRASLSHFAHLFWPGNQVASLPVATAAASAAAAAAAAADHRYKNVGAAERSTKQATPSSLAARTREWSWSRRLFRGALFFGLWQTAIHLLYRPPFKIVIQKFLEKFQS